MSVVYKAEDTEAASRRREDGQTFKVRFWGRI